MNRALKALGKSLVIVTGVGYGVIKAMDVLANDEDSANDLAHTANNKSGQSYRKPTPPDPAIQRLDGMEERLIRMEKSIEVLAREAAGAKAPSEPAQPAGQFITRTDLDRAMQRLQDDIGADIDRRFEVQNRSVQSLRAMIARTDELLEQVIENIESTQLTA